MGLSMHKKLNRSLPLEFTISADLGQIPEKTEN